MVAKQVSSTATNPGMDAPRRGLNLVSRQRAETYATTKPTMSAGTPDCFWAGETMMSGGIAAACSPGGSWPGRSIRSPNSSDQDVGNSHTARWLSFPMSELGQKRRSDHRPVTSGLPQSTDIVRPARLVRFVPQADNASSALPLQRKACRCSAKRCVDRRRSGAGRRRNLDGRRCYHGRGGYKSRGAGHWLILLSFRIYSSSEQARVG
jgi:hypothetical protein